MYKNTTFGTREESSVSALLLHANSLDPFVVVVVVVAILTSSNHSATL